MSRFPVGLRILLVDKPAEITSHDVVAVARRALGVRRIGHAGTLDPFATGLLVLGIGRATRLLEYMVGLDKEYEGTARLGVSTDSLDPEGNCIARDDRWVGIPPDRIRSVAASLEGTLAQTPPRYSAIKVQGVPAHRRARRGERVELEPRQVTVRSFEVVGTDLPEVRFRVTCSSGTYVRSLAAELGERLGTGCYLTALRRTRVGSFDVQDAAPLSALRSGEPPPHAWVEPLSALSHLGSLEVAPDEAALMAQGRRIPAGQRFPPSAHDPEPVVFVLPGGELVAVGAVRNGLMEPRKVFLRA